MKKILVSFCLAAATLLVGRLQANAQSWHQLSQSQRNALILVQGSVDVGRQLGNYNCKTWVQQRVVPLASGNATAIPANMNDFTWYQAAYVYAMPKPFRIEWCMPGQIVQMQVPQAGTSNRLPHTAIVASVSGSDITFLDCNWDGHNTIMVHRVSFAVFYGWVQGYLYTVYSVQ